MKHPSVGASYITKPFIGDWGAQPGQLFLDGKLLSELPANVQDEQSAKALENILKRDLANHF